LVDIFCHNQKKCGTERVNKQHIVAYSTYIIVGYYTNNSRSDESRRSCNGVGQSHQRSYNCRYILSMPHGDDSNDFTPTRTRQGIHRHQIPSQYRNAASGTRLKVQPFTHHHTAHYGQVLMSSIKTEVHNVVQCCQRRTEPWPQGTRTQNFVMIDPAVPEICSRQTDKLTQCSAPLLGWSKNAPRTQSSLRTEKQITRWTPNTIF